MKKIYFIIILLMLASCSESSRKNIAEINENSEINENIISKDIDKRKVDYIIHDINPPYKKTHILKINEKIWEYIYLNSERDKLQGVIHNDTLYDKSGRYKIGYFEDDVLIIDVDGYKQRMEPPKSYSNDDYEIETEYEIENINGTYIREDNYSILKINISGESWFGKTIIKSGFGIDYDNENAMYDNGVVRENELFDGLSGRVKIGYVEGTSLVTSLGGTLVTLRKQKY